ncbi:MAG: LytR C-terminal domain-containing protein [Bifidobacteriaceae bacterium]|jgi:hypothetical protein|nr:LytR C-terminal domain-containing protein [Bifidobacteriaceae bacterium]
MTTPGSVHSEREARKEFVRDRQRMVITVALIFLVACVVLSTLVLLGVFKSDKEKAVADATTNYGVTVPCVQKASKAPAYGDIRVRVLNGTDKSGIARAVSSALEYRGFAMQAVGDFTKNDVARTEIRFGSKGIKQAYTVYAQFNDAILRMDDRSNTSVDVIVGNTFDDLNTIDEISITKGATLKSVKGCVAVSKIDTKTLPKATK